MSLWISLEICSVTELLYKNSPNFACFGSVLWVQFLAKRELVRYKLHLMAWGIKFILSVEHKPLLQGHLYALDFEMSLGTCSTHCFFPRCSERKASNKSCILNPSILKTVFSLNWLSHRTTYEKGILFLQEMWNGYLGK